MTSEYIYSCLDAQFLISLTMIIILYIHIVSKLKYPKNTVVPSFLIGANHQLSYRRAYQHMSIVVPVVGAFVACWLPFIVGTTIQFIQGYEDVNWLDDVTHLITFLCIMNSRINPLIKCFKSVGFRQALCQSVTCSKESWHTPTSTNLLESSNVAVAFVVPTTGS
jgi:hypothetical protein